MKFLYILIFIFSFGICFSQQSKINPLKKGFTFLLKSQIDTAYVEKYPQKWWIRTQFGYQTLNLKINNEQETIADFEPFSKQYISLSVGGQNLFKIFGKSIGLSVGHRFYFPLFSKVNAYGSSNIFDNRLNFTIGKQFHADVIVLSYKGFYTKLNNEIMQLPTMAFRMLVGRLSYVLNFDEFSMEAAFNQTEIQKKGAFTSFLGLNYFYFDTENLPTDFYNDTSFFQNQAGIYGGIALVDKLYWRLPKLQYAASVSVAVNSVFPYENIKSLLISPTLKGTFFYKFKNGSLAFDGHTNILNVFAPTLTENSFKINPTSFYLSYIYRFDVK